MEIAARGWGRDHGENVIAKRDLATAEIGSFNLYSRQATYVTAESQSAKMNSPTIEIRFDSKIVLNGDYLVRVSLTKREIASLFFLLHSDTGLDDLIDEFIRVRKLHDSGPLPALPPLPFPERLLKKLDEIELSVRTTNVLRINDIVYVGDLVQKTAGELLRLASFGRRSVNEIEELLARMNLHFEMYVPAWPPENVKELSKRFSNLNPD